MGKITKPSLVRKTSSNYINNSVRYDTDNSDQQQDDVRNNNDPKANNNVNNNTTTRSNEKKKGWNWNWNWKQPHSRHNQQQTQQNRGSSDTRVVESSQQQQQQRQQILRPSSRFDVNNKSEQSHNINNTNDLSIVPSPVVNFLDQSNWLLNYTCDRRMAERLLAGHVTGTFLIRPSTTKRNSYALSVIVKGQVYHCLIDCVDPDVGYCFHPISAKHTVYPALIDLVLDYRQKSMYKHHHELDTTLLHPVAVAIKRHDSSAML